MKFSYNWICELVDGVDATPKELTRLITMKTAECEGLEPCDDDWIIEIDNKSLTNRPDLWGHHGMAREVAAILRKPLKEPARLELVPAGTADINVEILDFVLCPRYSLLVFDNVTVQPSPEWLRRRLESIGLNSINNIVDVTNYILAEIAQPMHAFDASTLQGGTIFVRRARAGEKIVALNEERYELDESNLVIADTRGPIAIAGVIGGLDTGIVDTTRRVALESANFHASNIRKTSAKLKLRTDASVRYEKAQDPVNTLRGLARAVELFEQVSPGIRIAGGLVDCRKEVPAPPPIKLPMEWLLKKLGRPIEAAEVRDILERLHFGVDEPEPGVFSVRVPSWRATRDISLKDDLVEEIGRIVGYDSIPPVAPLLPASVPPVNEERRFHHQVRDMAAAQGFTEVYNYSFVNEELARKFGFDPAAHVTVANPISEEQGLLRLSLVPNIWRNITENAKHFERFRLFEIGYEIHKRPGDELPDEVPHLAAAIYAREDQQEGIFELKRLAECLMPGIEARPAEPRSFEHPARAAELSWRGARVGRLFELHPSMVETGRAAIVDIDLREMDRLRRVDKQYRPIRRFPASAFDLSVMAPLRDLAGDLEKKLVALAGTELDAIEFVRQYSGPPLAEGVKSVSFRLTVAAPDRTLSSAEVGQIRQRIIDGMKTAGYELRV